MIRTHAKSLLLCAAAFAASAAPALEPALAQGLPGTWRDHDSEDRYDARGPGRGTVKPSRKIAVTAFRAADAGERLGKGRLVVGRPPAAADDTGGKLPVYEAAVIDELARRGYDTANAAEPGQIAEIGVSHSVAMPEEAPHKKVSGAASTTIGNRGSGFGLALAIDLSKPAKAIIATRLDLRIRDQATGRVLWEGHAEGESRADDGGIDNGAVAARLASALLAKFPDGQVVTPLAAVMP